MQAVKKEEKNTIYVGDIPQGIETNDLLRIFGLYGTIKNITFRAQPSTRDPNKKTTAYAYIVYELESSAINAIRNLNHSKLHNHEIRVMLYETTFKESNRNIWVKNLPNICDNRMLAACFEVFGPVVSAKVSKHAIGGQSKGYGFVQFVNKSDAKKAIKLSSALQMGGNELKVEKCEPKELRAIPEPIYTNLFFKDFPPEKAEEVEKKLHSYGKITSLYFPILIGDEGQKNIKGFGFANFENAECAKKAVDALHGSNYFSSDIPFYIQKALSKEQRKEEVAAKFMSLQLSPEKYKKNIFVSNINPDYMRTENDEQELLNLFGKFGIIRDYEISDSKSLKHPGKTAKILFETPEIAKSAIETMNGFEFYGMPLEVLFYKGVRERTKENILQSTTGLTNNQDEYSRKVPAKTRVEIFNSVKSLSSELESEWKNAGFKNAEEFADAVTTEMSISYTQEDINDMLSVGDSLLTNVKNVLKKFNSPPKIKSC
ncbi:Polyadenylate-binding protein, cytoplasmic and nuclear [Cucumispora dikerogammari]|nr:Polyadenylate-binding protein, cytoplasmic and nuclear [Cucumispora dikerogammari]